MAHYVICAICKQKFDRDKYPAILVTSRRYAHASCAGTLSAEETQKEKDRKDLEDYIIKLFNLEHMNGKITLQINKFLQDHPDYTYSGIKHTLEYFYDIKGNSIEKANGGIGIVPWVYAEARAYFYQQYLISQKNANKDINSYIPKTKVITIQTPKRKMRKRKIFTFLDNEEEG